MTLDARALKRFWTHETPSGTVNGSNTVFSIANTPAENEAVELYLDGLRLVEGEDFSLSGLNITMTTAPAIGQKLRASYIRRTGE